MRTTSAADPPLRRILLSAYRPIVVLTPRAEDHERHPLYETCDSAPDCISAAFLSTATAHPRRSAPCPLAACDPVSLVRSEARPAECAVRLLLTRAARARAHTLNGFLFQAKSPLKLFQPVDRSQRQVRRNRDGSGAGTAAGAGSAWGVAVGCWSGFGPLSESRVATVSHLSRWAFMSSYIERRSAKRGAARSARARIQPRLPPVHLGRFRIKTDAVHFQISGQFRAVDRP
jgi:hypothetical protein